MSNINDLLSAATATIRRLRARLHTQGDSRIAIVGVGLRVPGGATSITELHTQTQAGIDAVAPIPEGRERLGLSTSSYHRQAGLMQQPLQIFMVTVGKSYASYAK